MPQKVGTVTSELILDTRRATQAYQRFERTVARNRGRDSFLSGISADAKDFENSLGKATNRVVAFGAAAAIFTTISKAASAFASSIIEIDNSLAKINVNLGQSQAGLKKFGADLFNIARQTGQTFETTAKAAEELARQGLGAEETTKRLKDALVLSRIAGLDSAAAVETLTAAINSFNEEALTSTEVVNKFAAVDTKFAVSSRDLAEAVSRVGSTAQAAGVGINELIGLVTSLQQTTARGGATIGNGLKTIFTRIQAAPETVAALESVGVAIKNTDGSLRDALSILRDYGQARERLGEVERASIDRTVAGTYQINILKAALTDLNKEYSVYGNAVRTAAGATDEAIRKNEQLNETLSSLINQTEVSVKQLFAAIGGERIGSVLQYLFKAFEQARGFFSGDSGNDLGQSLGSGILQGLVAALGPAAGALGIVLGKAFSKVAVTIAQEARTLLSLNDAVQVRANIQKQINTLLNQATESERAQYAAASSVLAKKEQILAIQARINQESLAGTPLTRSFQVAGRLGIGTGVDSRIGRGSRYTGVPTFADPIGAAVKREIAAGAPANQVYVDRDARVASFANPMGLLVANRRDEPLGGYQGVNRVLSQGGNPKTNGIPGFANKDPLRSQAEIIARRFGLGDPRFDQQAASKAAPAVSALQAAIARSAGAVEKLEQQNKKLALTMSTVDQAFVAFNQELARNRGRNEYTQAIGPSYGSFIASRINRPGSFVNELPDLSNPTDPSTAQVTHRMSQVLRDNASFSYRTRRNRDIKRNRLSGGGPPPPSSLGDNLIEDAVTYDTNLEAIQAHQRRQQPSARDRYRAQQVQEARASGLRQRTIQADNERLGNLQGLLAQGQQSTIDRRFAKSQSRRQKQAAEIAQGRQNRSNKTLGAAFIAPFVGGFAEPIAQSLGIKTGGGTAGGIATGAISSASQFAGFGALTGNPIVAGVAAALGALVGVFTKLKKSSEEVGAELEEEASQRGDEADAISRVRALREQIKDAQDQGVSPSVIRKLNDNLLQATGKVTSAKGQAVLNATPGAQQDAAQRDLDAANALKDAAKNISDILAGRAKGKLSSAFLGGINEDTISSLTPDKLAALRKAGSGDFARPFDTTNKSDQEVIKEAKQRSEEFNKALEAVRPVLGDFVDISQVTEENLSELAQEFVKAANRFKGIVKDEERFKTPASGRLTTGSFLNKPDLDVFGRAGLTGRNPNANRNQRAQSQFDFFNELTSSGGVSKDLLEGDSTFKKARAGVQSQNITDLLIRFLQGNNPDVGSLRSENGNANLTAIERTLSIVAGSGTQNAALAKTLVPLVPKLRQTLKDVGATPIGDPLRDGPNFSSGLPRGGYSTFAGSGKRKGGSAQYVTSENLDVYRPKRGGYLDRFTPFVTKDNVGEFRPAERQYDLRQLPNPAPAAGRGGSVSPATLDKLPSDSQTAQQDAAARDADIDSYLKIAEDAKTAAETVAQATASIVQQAGATVAITVGGIVDPAMITAMQVAIQQLFDQQAASSGKPNPPAPTPTVPLTNRTAGR